MPPKRKRVRINRRGRPPKAPNAIPEPVDNSPTPERLSHPMEDYMPATVLLESRHLITEEGMSALHHFAELYRYRKLPDGKDSVRRVAARAGQEPGGGKETDWEHMGPAAQEKAIRNNEDFREAEAILYRVGGRQTYDAAANVAVFDRYPFRPRELARVQAAAQSLVKWSEDILSRKRRAA